MPKADADPPPTAVAQRSDRAKRPLSPTAADRSGSTPTSKSSIAAQAALSLDDRLQLREQFFQQAGIDPRQFLQAFDQIPGLDYFVKDTQSRTMLNTRKRTPRSGFRSEEEFVGRRAGEYLAKSLAEHYEADDQQVIRTGEPLRNIIEIMFDELVVHAI